MRKRFYLLSAMLLPLTLFAGVKEIPYSTTFANAEGDALDTEWTVIDANNDSKTWTFENSLDSSTGTQYGIKYSYSFSNAADDWCISPAIHLEAGKEYKLTYYMRCYSNTNLESYKIFMSTSASVSDLSATTPIIDEGSVSNKTFEKRKIVITPESTGDYYFAYYCYSQKNKWNLYMRSFSINYNVIIPSAVSGLTATVGAEEALTVDLAWTLPTKDDDGGDLGTGLTAVEVYRDGTLVKTLAGDATSFSDDAAQGLTPGFHNYSVVAVLGDYKSASTSVKTKYVGPVEPQAIPFTSDFSTQENFDALWTIVDANEDGRAWSYYSKCASYTGASGKPENDWLISPPLSFTEAGAYKVTVNAYGASSGRMKVMLGKGKTPESFTTEITDINTLTYSQQDMDGVFVITEPGTYYLATYLYLESPSYTYYKVYSMKVDKTVLVPEQVTDLKAVADAEGNLKATLTWTNPTKTNGKTDLKSLTKVELYRNNELAKTFTEVTPGQAMEYVDDVPAAGVYTYKVLVYNESGVAEGTPMEVGTSWIGDATQPLPYEYTFEDQDGFALWTVIDGNNDGKTWKKYSGYASSEQRTADTYSNCDEWLITPPFDVTPGYYKLTYKLTGNGNSMKVYYTTSNTDPSTNATLIKDDYKLSGLTYGYVGNDVEHLIKIDEAQKLYFAWQQYSYPTTTNICVADVRVEKVVLVPDIAQSVTVRADSNFDLKATIAWTNPTKNIIDLDLDTITKVEVYRNDELVGTVTEGLVPGETASYVDNTVPQAGAYTYKVKVYNENGCSDKAPESVVCEWIGGGQKAPFTADFSYTAFHENWVVENTNNDVKLESPVSWEVSGGSLYYISNVTVADDWAFSPRFQFMDKNNALYKLTLNSYLESGAPDTVEWEIAVGSSQKSSSMKVVKKITTHKSTDAAPAQGDVQLADYNKANPQEDVVDLEFGEGTVNVIGIHAKAAGVIYISKFELIADTTVGVGTISNNGEIRYANGTLYFVNGASQVAVYTVAGTLVEMQANVGNEMNISDLANGVYIVKAKIGNKVYNLKLVK